MLKQQNASLTARAAEIEEISKKDPYFLAGLFKTVEIFGFKKVF